MGDHIGRKACVLGVTWVLLLTSCGAPSKLGPANQDGAPARLTSSSGGPTPLTATTPLELTDFATVNHGVGLLRTCDDNSNVDFAVLGRRLPASGMALLYAAKGEPQPVRGRVLDALRRAELAWTAAVGNSTLFSAGAISGGGSYSSAARDGVSAVGWMQDSGGNAPLAVTTLFVTETSILEADIQLNACYAWNVNDPIGPGACAVGADGAFDVQSVITHEIGHVLGLVDLVKDSDANDERGSTMYFQIGAGELVPQTLSAGDIAGGRLLAPAP
ncbi:MAG: hypothetical protein HYU66_26100 [Armatimonadetes bacterium]|nr:hypothetical protein [Armatimonadota bacterium]